ncbi:RNA methyltransferase [uncultured Litoreibacter sp.]|uniref:RNA methyltransferase n=1 Tax=uncultured Litoreibacter sp. TaxID=1392394 RepID=UPI0026191557|nr:RNA methyltransferase [uncultured Litoreibacter sp.]
MSGTDHDAQAEWGGPQPVMVLVSPQMGENIGSAARGMLNFGLERMRLVDPRDGWPNAAATATASGAAKVLDHVTVYGTTADAVGDVDYVFATTARGRDMTKPVVTPEEAMGQARAMIAAGKNVAVLFGPERAGLENSDVAQANAIISVPVNPGFASLNLAQCVLLTAYEWRRQSDEAEIARDQAEAASQLEIQKLYEHFVSRLDVAGFFFPETKADSMKLHLRNMLSRMPLTPQDVQIFHGMLRQFVRWKERDD